MKVVIFAHYHPEVFNEGKEKGGSELVAYNLFKELNNQEVSAWFVGGLPFPEEANPKLIRVSEKEVAIKNFTSRWDFISTIDYNKFYEFNEFLKEVRPDIFHFHHYINLGLNLFCHIKNLFPHSKIVLTLHDFNAICFNRAMITTDGNLCEKASPEKCNKCFPDKPPQVFSLKERHVKEYFKFIDLFISPSNFLKSRYVEWGLSPDKILVIENGLVEEIPLPPRKLKKGECRGKFGFFGRITPLKGLDIVLEAFDMLPDRVKEKVCLHIHGPMTRTESFKKKIKSLMKKNSKIVKYFGPYQPSELRALMSEVDWVVMGSIWWENSPLVIQEAFKYKRPVICPNIGGMAEKVKDGKGGFTYQWKNPKSLAELICKVIEDEDLYQNLVKNIPDYKPLKIFALETKEVYENLILKK